MPPYPRSLLAALFTTLTLGACGGGGGGGSDAGAAAPGGECSVEAQKAWLAGYMDEWYFWSRLAPRPDPAAFTAVADFFNALRYTGTDPAFPADRWSGSQSTESYNRFFGAGQTLGYGVSVAGIEVAGQAGQPLYVRYVEPASPAAAAGLRRGDELLNLNGRAAAELILANDFGMLTATNEGQALSLQLRNTAGAERSLTLNAAIFALTPVSQDQTFTTANGQRMGYVVVKDMLSQATAPLEAAFTRLRSAGAQAVVLDLRYNGGGLVSVGATLASYVAGTRGQDQVFASLLYNDRRAASNNTVFRFSARSQAVAAPKVYVLTGQRTCSASEQVISGLRGVGIDVVLVGDTSCGKPVGFLPTARCGTTYSVVNFESVNALGQGRYFDGLAPTCSVVEDFKQPLGSTTEPLLAAALLHAATGACPRSSPLDDPGQRRSRAGIAGEGQQVLLQ